MSTNEDENCISTESDVRFNPPLYIQRYQKALDILSKFNVNKVADFGCAEGKFIRRLKKLDNLEEIAAIDFDSFALEQCLYEARPLAWDFIFGRQKQLKINVFKGNLAEKDSRLKNFDAITCIELIEHLSDDVLSQLPENIFGFIRPKVVFITTPNIEFNVLFNFNDSSKLRHWDHKFEWTRNQFQNWCQSIQTSFPDYTYELTGVGEPSNQFKSVGFCTQIAIFTKISDNCKQCKYNTENYELIDSFLIEKNHSLKDNKTDEPIIDWDCI